MKPWIRCFRARCSILKTFTTKEGVAKKSQEAEPNNRTITIYSQENMSCVTHPAVGAASNSRFAIEACTSPKSSHTDQWRWLLVCP